MGRYKFKNTICVMIAMVFILASARPIKAELDLTQEEKDYIKENNVVISVSSEGTAPFQYTNKKGAIRGISPRILEEISKMTGLSFAYKLYDGVEDVLTSNYDLVFGIPSEYAPESMVLSPAYVETETILYINTNVDYDDLEDKIYATTEGSSLPKNIKEKNTKYYKTREESLDAVENGEADYGHGNAYSIAYYTLQNGYRNIITVPTAIETREYSMGVDKENLILASIIDKSLEAIDERKLQTLILDEISRVDRKVTFSSVMDMYGNQLITMIILFALILFISVVTIIREKNKLKVQNKRYELLSNISNEYLYEYHFKNDKLQVTDKCKDLFESEEQFNRAAGVLKKALLNKDSTNNKDQIEFVLPNGKIHVFMIISSEVFNDKGRIYSLVGKLIDITDQVEEKNKLRINAQIDGLTGLYNSETTKKLINESIRTSSKDKKDALILLDFDKFKDVNDTFGHLAGDKALEILGRSLKIIFRDSDILGRIGGDEFCVYI